MEICSPGLLLGGVSHLMLTAHLPKLHNRATTTSVSSKRGSVRSVHHWKHTLNAEVVETSLRRSSSGRFLLSPHNHILNVSCESFVHIDILINGGGGTCSHSCPGRDEASHFFVIIHPFSTFEPFNLYLLCSKCWSRTSRVGQSIQSVIPK